MQCILIHLGIGLSFSAKLTEHVQIYHTDFTHHTYIYVRIVTCMIHSVNYIFWSQNTITNMRNVWFVVYTYILIVLKNIPVI